MPAAVSYALLAALFVVITGLLLFLSSTALSGIKAEKMLRDVKSKMVEFQASAVVAGHVESRGYRFAFSINVGL